MKSNIRKTRLLPLDIEGLPRELLETLSLNTSDIKDFEIINMIEDGGGTMSLDHILIGLYHKTNTVHDRIKISQRIYRMTTKDKLHRVKGMKAVYTTENQKTK